MNSSCLLHTHTLTNARSFARSQSHSSKSNGSFQDVSIVFIFKFLIVQITLFPTQCCSPFGCLACIYSWVYVTALRVCVVGRGGVFCFPIPRMYEFNGREREENTEFLLLKSVMTAWGVAQAHSPARSSLKEPIRNAVVVVSNLVIDSAFARFRKMPYTINSETHKWQWRTRNTNDNWRQHVCGCIDINVRIITFTHDRRMVILRTRTFAML